MASNTILEQLKEEANESKMVGLMKEMLNANTQAAKQALLEKLEKIGKEPTASCKINREIDNFKFGEPELSLDDWLNKVRRQSDDEPCIGMHWKVENGVAFANVEVNSHARNEEAAVRIAKLSFYEMEDKMSEEERAKWTGKEVDSMEFKTRREVWKWNLKARTIKPRWEVLKRTALGDTKLEDTALRYIRRPVKEDEGQVDWFKTIKELVRIGTTLGYTIGHYKATMDRWVSFFSPNMRNMTEPMDAGRQARLLMKMTAPDNEYDRLTHELYTLTRKAGTGLNVVLAQLSELATARAAEMSIENVNEEVARIMYKGFERFTVGKTKEEFLEAYEYNRREGKGQIPWERMLEKMIERERKYGMPTVDLKFADTAIPGSSTSAFVTRNYNVDTNIVIDPVPEHAGISEVTKKQEQEAGNRNSRDRTQDRKSRDRSHGISRDRSSYNRSDSNSRDRNSYNRSDSNSRDRNRYSRSDSLSRDRNRTKSSDRLSRDRNRRDNSRDRYRSNERNRNRDNDKIHRDNDRLSRRDAYDRLYRDQSRDRRQRSSSTNYYIYRDRRQSSYDRYNRMPSRDNSRNRQETDRRAVDRNRSVSRGRSSSGPYEWKPEYCDPGVNCAPGYSRDAAKTCSKCNIHTHREYECRRYKIWNQYKCRNCGIANHMENECEADRAGRRVSRSPGRPRMQNNLNL